MNKKFNLPILFAQYHLPLYYDTMIREKVKTLVKEFSKKLHIPEPRIRFTVAKTYVGRAMRRIGESRTKTIRINIAQFSEFFAIDKELAEKILTFVVAHEIGHLRGFIDYPDPILLFDSDVETIANRYAQELTGYSIADYTIWQREMLAKTDKLMIQLDRHWKLEAKAYFPYPESRFIVVSIKDTAFPTHHTIYLYPVYINGGLFWVKQGKKIEHFGHFTPREEKIKFSVADLKEIFMRRYVQKNTLGIVATTRLRSIRITIPTPELIL